MEPADLRTELAKVEPWSTVPAQELAELVGTAELHAIAAKTVVFAQGDRASDLYVLGRGAAKSVRHGPHAGTAAVARNVYRGPCVIVTASFLDRQLELATGAAERARDRYAAGAASYVDVLDAVRTLQTLERTRLSARRELFQHRIDLYRALAGDLPAAEGSPP